MTVIILNNQVNFFMFKVLGLFFSLIQKIAIIAVIAYFGYEIISSLLEINSLSVTWLNWIFGVITLVIGTPLAIAGAMANDSGKGGFIIGSIQFLLLSIPLVYLIGLVGSISVLYMDQFEGQQETAIWLASLTGIHLSIVAVFIGMIWLKEKTEPNN